MQNTTYHKVPCTYEEGKLITIQNCEECKKCCNCDIYAMILDDLEESA